ncbi:hypothetical protein EYF80_029096 [Liparis tanakae]|uniref:Uncharacterized protein n=1 Tax=Liparis tanakae TaxID=230148 RepID=A0A4Z2H7F7_9TELE|nr:hypothetical protein EYF80_029096 [Liparis tanakae]
MDLHPGNARILATPNSYAQIVVTPGSCTSTCSTSTCSTSTCSTSTCCTSTCCTSHSRADGSRRSSDT